MRAEPPNLGASGKYLISMVDVRSAQLLSTLNPIGSQDASLTPLASVTRRKQRGGARIVRLGAWQILQAANLFVSPLETRVGFLPHSTKHQWTY